MFPVNQVPRTRKLSKSFCCKTGDRVWTEISSQKVPGSIRKAMKLQFREVAILSDFAVNGFTCVCVLGILTNFKICSKRSMVGNADQNMKGS